MRFIFLSTPETVFIDCLAWFSIHLGISFALTKISFSRFNPGSFPFKQRNWELEGKLYEKFFYVKLWKDKIPDAAAWFRGGFPKKNLVSLKFEYLDRFIRETCRGETVHAIVLLTSPLFFLWNPLWVGIVMIGYALLSNLPCIITQRYNRIRFYKLLLN